jgi:hypothetical protein
LKSAKRFRGALPPVGRYGVLKKALMAHLRTARQMRQAKGGTTKSGLGQIVDAVSIRERPAEAEDRAVPGHWEGDLLSGANNTHIATLVERHTRFTMLLRVPSKDTATVIAALGKHLCKVPQELRRSLTWDRGKEMADHKHFIIATNVQVYFCDPRSPWQRGSNENTNGLPARVRHARLAETVMPSLSSSPWILGAPQSGLARLMSRTSVLMSADSLGRPPSDFDFHRQYKRKPARCHRITVSGLTIAKALSTLGAKPYSPANFRRSMLPKLGRLGDFRRRILS